jgi:RNA polymerase sigma-70 factor (ECF subfamily)
VYRHCLNDVRNKKVARKREENYQQTQSAETAFIDLAAVQELDSAIQLAIENLHPQCKAIFCKSRFESMTYAEIATSMNLSVKTIENQMGRALKLLREKVGSR